MQSPTQIKELSSKTAPEGKASRSLLEDDEEEEEDEKDDEEDESDNDDEKMDPAIEPLKPSSRSAILDKRSNPS